MPKKVVENINPKYLPNFPVLSSLKTSRVVTKHFTNLYLYLKPAEVSFLGWLIYQVAADNTIKYDTELLENYSFSLLAAKQVYKSKAANHDIKAIREVVKGLIESGYFLKTQDEGIFMLNPMLSYRTDYVTRGEYKRFMEQYNSVDVFNILELIIGYRELINKYG